jgi:membrane protease YdiL (CAAX protease family)
VAPGEAAVQGLLWLLAFAAIAVFEEVFFRGYGMLALAEGIGFWPAALVSCAAFGLIHYLGKPDETWVDLLAVTALGAFLCLTIRRTGRLWLAIGFHLGYNLLQMFVLGGPNSGNAGQPVAGHLLDTRWVGPPLLTGGPTGIEASVLGLPVIALLFVLFAWRHPLSRREPDGSAASTSRAAA